MMTPLWHGELGLGNPGNELQMHDLGEEKCAYLIFAALIQRRRCHLYGGRAMDHGDLTVGSCAVDGVRDTRTRTMVRPREDQSTIRTEQLSQLVKDRSVLKWMNMTQNPIKHNYVEPVTRSLSGERSPQILEQG